MDSVRLCCTGCSAVYRSAFARCPGCGEPLAPLDGDPLVGTTFAGRYVVEELIGEGAMSRVYRARHSNLSRRFALKVLFGELAADATMRLRFAKEAEVASRLAHPNVVSVTDFGNTEGGLLYLVMDYVEGRDLGAIIAEEGPMPADRVIELARQMASGLQHAHDRGLVHRDFKPENVVVIHDDSGARVPRILDFGLAISSAPEEDQARLTMTGTVVGTPIYIAPEQACGLEVDNRADLFSLGVCLYEMLAGQPPFDGQPMEVVRLNVTALPPRIAARSPGVTVDPALEEVVRGLMERDRDQRYASAEEVIEALDELTPPEARRSLYRAPSDARPVVRAVRSSEEALARAMLPRTDDLVGRSWPPLRPRRGLRAAGVLAAAALALGVVGWSLPGEREAAPAAPRPPIAEVLETALEQPALAATAAIADDGVIEIRIPVDRPEPDSTPAADTQLVATSTSAQPANRPAASKPPQRARPRAPSAESLTRRYSRVGRALDRLAADRGEAAAAPLSERYFAIPYADALRHQDLRSRVDRDLRRLERRVARAADP